jgi:hypothetical protein
MTAKPKTRKAPTNPVTGGPDAKLIALGMQLDAAWAHEKSIEEVMNDFSDDAFEAAFEAATDVSSAIVDHIEELTATTIAGARVKAKAVWWCHNGEEIDDDFFSTQCTTDVRIAAGLVRDLLEIGRKPESGAPVNRRWRKLDSGKAGFQVLLKSLAELREEELAGLPVWARIGEVVDMLARYRIPPAHEPLELCGHGEPGQGWGSA